MERSPAGLQRSDNPSGATPSYAPEKSVYVRATKAAAQITARQQPEETGTLLSAGQHLRLPDNPCGQQDDDEEACA
ncbi:hypothetical protein EYF80_022307 [Liparis tanakae]|uniref:Uncharacterized protein n=1 Tax=Liparis tanakae TaxID=230148 RepID=A0A4Z2HPK3_9TELE|nr:hypothetical protein EYF80_022307 [Liparis tanakae]